MQGDFCLARERSIFRWERAKDVRSSLAGIFRGLCRFKQERHARAISEMTLSAKPKTLELFGGHWEL